MRRLRRQNLPLPGKKIKKKSFFLLFFDFSVCTHSKRIYTFPFAVAGRHGIPMFISRYRLFGPARNSLFRVDIAVFKKTAAVAQW